jgi:carboxylesterase type B
LNPEASDENEECLFLDLVVPKSVFDDKARQPLVPVIFLLHGGGFTLGSKYAAGNPTSLLDQSLDLDSNLG